MVKCEYQRKSKKRVGSVDDFISGCPGGRGVSSFSVLFLYRERERESNEKDGKEEEEKIMKELGKRKT